MQGEDLEAFCRRIPKLELHAHLNGSIRPETLRFLASNKGLCHLLPPLDAIASKADAARPVIPSTQKHRIMRLFTGSSCSMEECFSLFPIIHQLTSDHSSISLIARQVVLDFAAENVVYLELRTTPKEREGMTKESYVQAVLNGITLAGEELQDQRILVKLLLSIDRREGHAESMNTVDVAKKFSGSGVVGVDLSGNPSVGSWETWEPALREARKAGLKVTLHGGEVPEREAEALSQLEFKPDRFGHMCYMERHVKEKFLASRIPLELCLTSNIKTRTFSSYEEHHFKHLFEAKHPLVICTDDSGMFRTSLSHEYAIVMQTFCLTGEDIHHLVRESIEYTFASNAEKAELRACVLSQLANCSD